MRNEVRADRSALCDSMKLSHSLSACRTDLSLLPGPPCSLPVHLLVLLTPYLCLALEAPFLCSPEPHPSGLWLTRAGAYVCFCICICMFTSLVCGLLCPPAYVGMTCTPLWEEASGDTVTDEAGVVGERD